MIADIERRASLAGIKPYVACARAGIAPTTYYRWKNGSKALLDNLIALSAAVDDIANGKEKIDGAIS